MKKLINDPDAVVREALEGMEAAHGGPDPGHPRPERDRARGRAGPGQGRHRLRRRRGHEPMHGGFVGRGMLDAACPGEVFTSPTPDQMLEATKAVDGGAGVLHIVKNYTGDVLNFEMAADLAAAEGIEVEAVVTNDDVAVKDCLYTAGRRGVGGTVIAEKICGAAAEERRSRSPRSPRSPHGSTARAAAWASRSRRASRPAPASRASTCAEDEIEIGIGIHGEPGREREQLGPAAEIVDRAGDRDRRGPAVRVGDKRAAFVNGMGGTPLIELYIVFRELDRVPRASAASRSSAR